MHIPLWTTTLHAAPSTAASIIARTTAEEICLPHDLQAAVQSCALRCIQTFILNNYHDHTCSSTADLDFLCTNKTTSGLTIGEGSLQCAISNCLGADIETQSGYNICDGVRGAIPNTAETITATVNSITTIMSPSTPTIVSTSATSDLPVPILTEPSTPTPTTFEATADASSATFGDSVSSADASAASFASITTRVSASSTDGIGAVRTSSSSQTTVSSSASATVAAATENGHRTELSITSIVGIATASVVAAALIAGYLAYLWVVRRKEKQRRRSQRLSTLFPPKFDDATGSAPPVVAEKSQGSSLPDPTSYFNDGETAQEKRKSFWRRSLHPPLQDIGVAVAPSTRVSPERLDGAPGLNTTTVPLMSQTQMAAGVQFRPIAGDNRWSLATSFDEDIEAQSQDIPILGGPKARSSGRSFSSAGAVEKPAPLRLSKPKPRPETPPSVRMPQTPVYDNGTFEPTIRQVPGGPFVEEPASITRQLGEPQVLNFSRRQPSLTRTSQEQSRPFTVQMRQNDPAGRFPVKPGASGSKQSRTSNQSVSVYTDIEEDDTPEQEEDKQLDKPATANMAAKKQPLRDLQWPQMPRPAAVAKQSQKVHSPRAMTIRQADLPLQAVQAQTVSATRNEMIEGGRSFIKTNTSSSYEVSSQSSVSPVFPTPPNYRSTNVQANLVTQISSAYRAASRPTTATTPTKSSRYPNPEMMFRPNAPQPGQMYQQIQRLSTGRPLAHKFQAQRYMPDPMARSTSRARITPMTSRSGDLYLTVGEMEH